MRLAGDGLLQVGRVADELDCGVPGSIEAVQVEAVSITFGVLEGGGGGGDGEEDTTDEGDTHGG